MPCLDTRRGVRMANKLKRKTHSWWCECPIGSNIVTVKEQAIFEAVSCIAAS